MVHTTVFTDLVTKKCKNLYVEYRIYSLNPLYAACSLTQLFPLENFNLLLNSNDLTTSHLKHPHQKSILSTPLKDARAEERQHLLTGKALFYSPLNLSRSR